MAHSLSALIEQAVAYANAYAAKYELDDELKDAIFVTHLAYLINTC